MLLMERKPNVRAIWKADVYLVCTKNKIIFVLFLYEYIWQMDYGGQES